MAATAAGKAAPMIYSAIAGVIADVGAVGKDKVNKQQGFKFRSVDDVYNALHPALAKNKVFIVPQILNQERETKKTKNGTEMTLVICKIKFTFYAEDGSNVETIIIGEALDTGDKATNKAMAIAYKYACFQVFCIPTEEMTDPDEERPELEGDDAKPAAKKSASKRKGNSGKAEEPAAGKPSGEAAEGADSKVTEAMVLTLQGQLERTGVEEGQLLKMFRVKSLEEMSVEQFRKAMNKFQITPDKEA